jgi:hypothetical protein
MNALLEIEIPLGNYAKARISFDADTSKETRVQGTWPASALKIARRSRFYH